MAAGDRLDQRVRYAQPQTTDATQTTVTALTFTMPANLRLVQVRITGSATRTNGGQLGVAVFTAFINHRATVRRYDGDDPVADTLLLRESATGSDLGASGYSVAIVISGNDIQVKITGVAAETVRWLLTGDYEIYEETVDVVPAA